MTITIKRSAVHTFEINGQTIETKRIGRGRYCTAYRAPDNRVFLVCPDNDYSKDILADVETADYPTIPRCVLIGETSTARVFETDYSETVRAREHGAAWKILKELETTRVAIWSERVRNASERAITFQGYDISCETIERANVPDYVKTDLTALLANMANYGSSWCFEFAKRNIGVSNGLIQFRDCCFDIVDIQRANGARRR
jgi:hypothetical protein